MNFFINVWINNIEKSRVKKWIVIYKLNELKLNNYIFNDIYLLYFINFIYCKRIIFKKNWKKRRLKSNREKKYIINEFNVNELKTIRIN